MQYEVVPCSLDSASGIKQEWKQTLFFLLQRQRELGEARGDDSVLKDLCTRCKHLLKLAKWQRLAEFEQLQEQLCDELWLNWTQRNFAAAWRLARRLAFKSLGAKCNSLRQVSQRPLAESFVRS